MPFYLVVEIRPSIDASIAQRGHACAGASPERLGGRGSTWASPPAAVARGIMLLGQPDRAPRSAEKAVALVEVARHPFTTSRGLYWAAALRQFRGDWPSWTSGHGGRSSPAGSTG